MVKLLYSLMLIVVIAGCGGEKANKYSLESEAKPGNAPPPMNFTGDGSQGLEFGIGDVESAMRIESTLPTDVLTDNIRQQIIENKREEVSKVDVVVLFPYPETLPMRVTCRSVKNYPPGSSARITINLYLDDEIIETFQVILGEKVIRAPVHRDFDIMPHIDLVKSDSFLFHARGVIEYFPTVPGDQLTFETEATPDVTSTTKLGNPIRVSFKP